MTLARVWARIAGSGPRWIDAEVPTIGQELITSSSDIGDVGFDPVGFYLPGTVGAELETLAAAVAVLAGTGGQIVITVGGGNLLTFSLANPFSPPGRTDASAVTAGAIGEYFDTGALVAGADLTVSGTSYVASVTTPLVLAAGDWDTGGSIYFTGTATTVTALLGGIGTVNGPPAVLPTSTQYQASAGFSRATALPAGYTMILPNRRFNLGSSLAIFPIANATFATGTMAATAFLWARRAS